MRWAITDSNCGLSACKADTLTTELIAHTGVTGFEPVTCELTARRTAVVLHPIMLVEP